MSYGGSRGGYGLGALLNPQGDQINSAATIESAMAIENEQKQQQSNDELSRYQIQGAKMQSDLERMTYNDSMIAHAARTAQGDPDQWDKNFQALDAQGIPGARQWVGRYSPAAMDAITRGYDPQAPLARATRPSKGDGPSGPGDDTDYDRLFAQTPADQIPQIADRTGRAMDLLASVKDAPTWEAAKAQAQKLGITGADKMGSYSPLKVQVLYEHLLGVHDYLSGRVADQGLGIPAPLIQSKTANVGDTLFSLNEQTPSGIAEATPIAHVSESTFVGIDKSSGRPIYHDTRPVPGTQPDTMGPYAVQPKGSRGAGSAFDSKMQGWLSVYPGDQKGALAYANGQKQMTDQQVTDASLKLATADLHSALGAGQQIDDPQAYVETRRREYEADLRGNAAAAPAGNGGGNQRRQQYDNTASIAAARAALARGAPRAKVLERLRQAGINTAGL